jgi:hypothetical protein
MKMSTLPKRQLDGSVFVTKLSKSRVIERLETGFGLAIGFVEHVYRTEPFGTPACITLVVDISSSTETLNFLCERKESISFIKLGKNSNLDNFL